MKEVTAEPGETVKVKAEEETENHLEWKNRDTGAWSGYNHEFETFEEAINWFKDNINARANDYSYKLVNQDGEALLTIETSAKFHSLKRDANAS